MPKRVVKKRVVKKVTPKRAAKKSAPKIVVVKRRVAPKVATVCLQGYKISKAGRCIKDKKYQTVIQSSPIQLRESNSVSFGMVGPRRQSIPVAPRNPLAIPEAPLRPRSGFTIRAPMSNALIKQKMAMIQARKKLPSLRESNSISFGMAGPKGQVVKSIRVAIPSAPARPISGMTVRAPVKGEMVRKLMASFEVPQITKKDVETLGQTIQQSIGGKPVSKKVAEATGAAFIQAAEREQNEI
jgi:hypothetical protein